MSVDAFLAERCGFAPPPVDEQWQPDGEWVVVAHILGAFDVGAAVRAFADDDHAYVSTNACEVWLEAGRAGSDYAWAVGVVARVAPTAVIAEHVRAIDACDASRVYSRRRHEEAVVARVMAGELELPERLLELSNWYTDVGKACALLHGGAYDGHPLAADPEVDRECARRAAGPYAPHIGAPLSAWSEFDWLVGPLYVGASHNERAQRCVTCKVGVALWCEHVGPHRAQCSAECDTDATQRSIYKMYCYECGQRNEHRDSDNETVDPKRTDCVEMRAHAITTPRYKELTAKAEREREYRDSFE